MSLDREAGGTRVIVLISALLAMAGAIFGGKNLTGLKPEHPVFARDEAKGDSAPEEVGPASHIWNDPFQGDVLTPPDENPKKLVSLKLDGDAVTSDLRLLFCLLDPKSFPENVDDRRRARVALHGAMHRMGYAPESSQQLRTTSFRYEPRSEIRIPYERFYRREGLLKEWVLCLYVDEDKLGDKPVGMLNNIRGWIGELLAADVNDAVTLRTPTYVLGPTTSLRARKFLEEATGLQRDTVAGGGVDIECYMTGASIGREALLNVLPALKRDFIGGSGEQGFGYVVGSTEVRMRRAPSDHSLSALLIKELALRGVVQDAEGILKLKPAQDESFDIMSWICGWLAFPECLKSNLPKAVQNLLEPAGEFVLLVAEQDSEYGRTLEREVRDEIARIDPEREVKTYWFPRGLDGYTPQAEAGSTGRGVIASSLKAAATGVPASKSLDPRGAMGHATVPFGDSMLDYLERLTIDLGGGSAGKGNPKISAIGILCNDVFDKIMIMKALRPSFSRAWFFTTDMDAQMFQRGNINATHNLIVASALNLTSTRTSDENTSDVVDAGRVRQFPFRSALQKTVYQGTLCLLKPDEFKLSSNTYAYEVGLSGAVPMGQQFPTLENYEGWLLLAALAIAAFMFFPYPSNPIRHLLHTIWNSVRFLVIGLGLLVNDYLQGKKLIPASDFATPLQCALLQVAGNLAKHKSGYYLAQLQLAVGYLCGVALCFWAYSRCKALTNLSNEEHFYWTAGVSVWPTEFFRAVLVTLCLYWYARIVFRQAVRIEEIEEQFPDLAERSQLKPRPSRILRVLVGVVKEFLTLIWGSWRFDRKADTLECWKEYKRATGVFPTLFRCLLLTYALTFFQLSILAKAFDDRHIPVRGLGTMEFDVTLTTLLVLGLSLVASVVIDCAMMSSHAIHVFAEKPSDWTKTIAKRYHNLNIGEPSDRLIDLAVVGRITDTVLQHSYFLYLLLLGTMLSRIFFFDNWNWSPFVIQFFASYFLMVLAAEYFLAHQCNRIRNRTVEGCETRLLVAVSPEREQLQQICTQIRGMQTGGFRSFSENPVARAVLVPLGGASAVGLLQYVALWTW